LEASYTQIAYKILSGKKLQKKRLPEGKSVCWADHEALSSNPSVAQKYTFVVLLETLLFKHDNEFSAPCS
jgi:hypothetical protein